MTLSISEILKILPHRFPFVLIDRILSMDPEPAGKSWIGRKAIAIKNVTINEPFFSGHFPEKPIMPGVLIVEAMAQAAAICGHRPPSPGVQMEVVIAGIDNARFRKPVLPGDQLKLVVEIKKDRGSIFAFHGEAFVEDQIVAEADFIAASYPKKDSL